MQDWVVSDSSTGGRIERLSARFQRFAFSPHRHDCYAVGITTTGIQCFTYRGAARASVAGQGFILHPDELHDGRAGDDSGFGYRIAYVDPSLIREMIDDRSLPFVADPVTSDEAFISAVNEVLDSAGTNEELAQLSSIAALSQALIRLSGQSRGASAGIDRAGVAAARAFLNEHCTDRVSLEQLEAVSGMSRWQLSRQFRELYAVSPYRYLLMRRLARARSMISEGAALADTATACGFADQSHLNRQFRAAFGVAPGQWKALVSPA
jgi:AraC-like DNA-binding protein